MIRDFVVYRMYTCQKDEKNDKIHSFRLPIALFFISIDVINMYKIIWSALVYIISLSITNQLFTGTPCFQGFPAPTTPIETFSTPILRHTIYF